VSDQSPLSQQIPDDLGILPIMRMPKLHLHTPWIHMHVTHFMPVVDWTQVLCAALHSLYDKLIVAKAGIDIESQNERQH
jgi:hypothetical protein